MKLFADIGNPLLKTHRRAPCRYSRILHCSPGDDDYPQGPVCYSWKTSAAVGLNACSETATSSRVPGPAGSATGRTIVCRRFEEAICLVPAVAMRVRHRSGGTARCLLRLVVEANVASCTLQIGRERQGLIVLCSNWHTETGATSSSMLRAWLGYRRM